MLQTATISEIEPYHKINTWAPIKKPLQQADASHNTAKYLHQVVT